MVETNSKDPNHALYENIVLLNDLLYQTLATQLKPDTLSIISRIADKAKLPYENKTSLNTAIESIWGILAPLENKTLLVLCRVFSQFLNLTNIAEQYHRIRRRRWHQGLGHPPQPGSLEAALPSILQAGITKERLFKAVTELNIELVLTAHPTEVTRRTLIHKYNEIAKNLERLDHEHLSPDERDSVIQRLNEEILALYLTPEIRPKKPSVIEEAKLGFAVVEESLWGALPAYLRDLDNKLQQNTGFRLPLDCTPLRFASWIGGDRDGNPNVTAKITRQVIFLARRKAAELFYKDLLILQESLSLQDCNEELRNLVGESFEPYRQLLRSMKEKLLKTQYWAECQMEERELCPSTEFLYLNTEDFLEPLLVCYRSLSSIGAQALANGQLLDVIRRATSFGLTLLPIDIRQHAEKHTALMDALTQSVDLTPYSAWPETERQAFLLEMLAAIDRSDVTAEKASHGTAKRLYHEIFTRNITLPEELQDYLEIFRVLTENNRASFGVYIISMAIHPSDVLLVFALQKAVGISKPIRVVPLFETLEALNNAANCIDTLLNIQVYKDACAGKQEVMIGYSDSAKDAGFLAASWAQYRAQEALTRLGQEHGIRMVFFHGRGGSVGRGGGPSYLAIRSQPPGSINGALRVTQQGEVIRYRFGLQKIAERTLAIYTTATLEASLLPDKPPLDSWRHLMDQLSEASMQSYRALVKGNSDFIRYFTEVTPVKELDKMTIASRPSRRQATGAISSLRAIPWMFAWMQNRLVLPAWYGVGAAFSQMMNKSDLKIMNAAKKDWSYFSSMLSILEMGIAKIDAQISQQYEAHLADQTLWPLGGQLRAAYDETRSMILKFLHEKDTLVLDSILKRSIMVRSPYLLILHILQILLLKRSRQLASVSKMDEILERALLVSIAGIAAGMLNTG